MRVDAGARRGTAADVELGDLGDRRRGAKVFDEPRRAVDERAIRLQREGGELVERGEVRRRTIAELFGVEQRGFERGGHQRLEIAAPELGIRVLARDDLALLGDPQPVRDAARGLREDRLVARSRRPARRCRRVRGTADAHPGLARDADERRAPHGTATSSTRGSRRPCCCPSSRASPPASCRASRASRDRPAAPAHRAGSSRRA